MYVKGTGSLYLFEEKVKPKRTITIRGARYYRYTDKPRCGLEKIRIAIWFGRIGSLGNLR